MPLTAVPYGQNQRMDEDRGRPDSGFDSADEQSWELDSGHRSDSGSRSGSNSESDSDELDLDKYDFDDVHRESRGQAATGEREPALQGNASGRPSSSGRQGIGMAAASRGVAAAAAALATSPGDGDRGLGERRGSLASVASQPGMAPRGYGRRDSSLDVAGAALFDNYDYDIDGVDETGGETLGRANRPPSHSRTPTPVQERSAMATLRQLENNRKATPPPPP